MALLLDILHKIFLTCFHYKAKLHEIRAVILLQLHFGSLGVIKNIEF